MLFRPCDCFVVCLNTKRFFYKCTGLKAVEAELCGVIAGIVAATLSYFGFMMLSPKLSNYGINVDTIRDILESNKLILMYLVFIIIGVIIGRVSARFAVQKYLRKM